MNKGYIYFGTYDGELVDQYEIIKMASLVSGKNISSDDFDSIRAYAKTCKGIKNEVKKPSIKFLLEHGNKVKAIKTFLGSIMGLD